MKITTEAYKELQGLYVNQIVANKYDLNEQELQDIRENNAYFAERLDELKVPWKIQNAVANAGTNRENWGRYNKDVINEVLEKYNK